MAVTIDERVVEMRFNNKQFEEGVKQSLNSLNKLDETIDKVDGNAGLDNLQKKMNNMDLTKIENSLQSLEKRFSTFGIAGMTVIQDLTRGVEGLAKSMLKLINKPFAQIKSGGWKRAMNIEDAKFQLEGLKVAWEDVYADIDYAVSGTAYGLDAAAKAASQLVATGVEFGKTFGDTGNSPMAKALRGISGVAAMANSTYEEIAPIFTTVAGQGKLMTMQLRQLEARGLNAAAELGKALGKTEQEVREMVSAGLINFQMFSEAMDDAFGEHAKDANKTFTGAFSNMKAALSRIGADVATEVLQDMVGVFNELRLGINKLHKVMQPTLDEINKWVHIGTGVLEFVIRWIFNNEKLEKSLLKLQNGFITISRWLASAILNAAKNSGPLLKNVQELGKALSDLFKAIFKSESNINVLQAILNGISYILTVVIRLLNVLVGILRDIVQTLANSKKFQKLIDTLRPFAKVILPLLVTYLILSKLHLLKVALAITAIGTAIAAIQKFGIIEKLKNLPSTISDLGSKIKTGILDTIKKIAEWFGKLKEPTDKASDGIKTIGTATTNAGTGLGLLSQGLIKVKDAIGLFLQQLEPAKIMLFTLGVAVSFTMVTIAKAIKNVSAVIGRFNPFTWLNTIAGSIKKYLDDLGNAAKMKESTKLIIAVAAGLVALATAAAIISKYVDPKNFLMVAGGIAAMAAAISLLYVAVAHFKTKTAKAFNPLENALASLQTVANGLNTLFTDLGTSAKMTALAGVLISIGIAIGALTSSIILLYKTVPTEKLGDILKAMALYAAIAAGLVTVVGIFSKLSGATRLSAGLISLSMVFASLSISMLIMAKAIRAFQDVKMDFGSLAATFGIMAASATLLIGVAWAASKVLDKFTDSVMQLVLSAVALSAVFLALPRVIESFGKALKMIGEAFDGIEIFATSGIILAVGIVIAGLVAVSRLAKKAAAAVTIMIGSVAALALLMNYLAKLGANKEAMANIKAAFKELIGVIAVFGGVISVILLAAGRAKYALRSAVFLLSLPATLLMMVQVFKSLSKAVGTMDVSTLVKTLAAFSVILVALGAAMALASNFQSGWKSLLSLSAVILALTTAIGLLGWLAEKNPAGIIVGAIALATGLVGLAKVMQAASNEMKQIKVGTLVKIIIAMVAALGTISGALYIVMKSGADWKTLAASAVAMRLALFTISSVFKQLTEVGTSWDGRKWSKMKKSLGVMVALSADLLVVAAALRLVAESNNWGSILSGAAGLSLVMATLGEVLSVIMKASTNVDKTKIVTLAGAMMILSVSLIPAAAALMLLANYDWQKILVAAGSLSFVMIILGGILGVLAKVTTATKPGELIEIADAMLVLSVGVAAIAASFSLLKDVDWHVIVAAATSIGILTAVLAVAAGVLAALPMVGEVVIPILSSLAAVLAGVGVAALGFGAGMGIALAAASLFVYMIKDFIAYAANNADAAKNGLIKVGEGAKLMFANIGVGMKSALESVSDGIGKIALAIGKGIVLIGKAIAQGLVNISEGITAFILNVTTAIGLGLLNIVASVDEACITLIQNVGLRGAQLLQTVYELIIQLGNTIRTGLLGLKDILLHGGDIGAWLSKSVASGMLSDSRVAERAAVTLGGNIEEAFRDRVDVHSKSAIWAGIGEWLTKSVAVGVATETPTATKSVEELGGALNDAMTDKATEAGANGGSNLISGFDSFITDHKDWFTSIADKAAGYFGGEFGSTISNIVSGVGGIFNTSTPAFNTSAAKDMAMKEVQARYYSDASFRAAVDAERNYNSATRGSVSASSTQAWMKALTASIERQKKAWEANNDSASGLAKWLDQLNGKIDEATEQMNNYGDAIPDPTAGMEDFADIVGGSGGAASAIDELRDSIAGAIDIFGEFDNAVTITGKNMLQNIDSQINKVNDWSKAIQILAARGFDSGLIQQLIDMGPDQSYQYVSALLQMSKKQMNKYNAKFKESLSLPDKTVAALEGLYAEDGAAAATAFSEAAWDTAFTLGNTYAALNEKQLTKAFKEMFAGFKAKKWIKMTGVTSLLDSLNRHIKTSGKNAKEAKASFMEYIAEAYAASLDEEQLREAIAKDSESLAKDVKKWWKQQTKAVKDSVWAQMRSMSDLSSMYKQTGDELLDSITKQNKDYQESVYNRAMLTALAYSKGWKKFGKWLQNEASDDQILSLLEGYTTASAEGGESAGLEWLKEFKKALINKGGVSDIADVMEQLSEYITTGNTNALRELADNLAKSTTKFQSAGDKYIAVLKGINEGVRGFQKSSKVIRRVTLAIARNFSTMANKIGNMDAVAGATQMVEQYAMSLLDLEAIQEEAAETGADVAELVKRHVAEVKQSIESMHDSTKSSIKGMISWFDKFDDSTTITFADAIANMTSWSNGLAEYRRRLSMLKDLGYTDEVIQNILDMGFGSESLATLRMMTDASRTKAEIDHINVSLHGAMLEGEETAVDMTAASIQSGSNQAESEITAAGEQVSETVEETVEDATEVATDTIETGTDEVVDAFTEGATEASDAATQAAVTVGNAVVDAISEEAKKAKQAGKKLGKKAGKGIVKGLESMVPEVKSAAKNLGKQIDKGMIAGMQNHSSEVSEAAKKVAKDALKAAKKALAINSPSKEFEWIGEMADKGLAMGFADNEWYVEDSMNDLTDMLMAYAATLANDLANSEPFNDDWVIKPVLDLDNLQNAGSDIRDLLGDGNIAVRSSLLASQASATTSGWGMLAKAISGMPTGNQTTTYGDTTIVVNPPAGADSREIAEMVMIEIQRQTDRRQRT